MRSDPEKHHRRSVCLKEYDYCQPGVYFVTICTRHRECLFGEIVGGEMRLNPLGTMAVRGMLSASIWQRGFYERIIRTEDELRAIGEYILANPARWNEDENNPALLNSVR